jgi:hypothetical protein
MDKSQYLTPWKELSDSFYFIRYSIDNHYWLATVYTANSSIKNEWWAGSETGTRLFKTKEQAMECSDKELLDRGYVLLTQEQYDKLIILL